MPAVDYDALARKFGGRDSAQPAVDYEALAAKFGAQPVQTFEVQSPSGNTYEIEAPSMPSGAQLQALVYQMEHGKRDELTLAQRVRAKHPGAYDDLDDATLDRLVRTKYPGAYDDIPSSGSAAQEPKSAAYRFVHGVADQLNPVTALKAVGSAIMHPLDTGKALVDAQSERAIKAYDLAKEGRYSEAAGNAGAAVLPLLGPVAAEIGEQAGAGDVAGAAGRLTGLLVTPRVAGNAAKAAKVAAPVLRDTVIAGGKATGAAAKAIGPEVAAAAVGNAVSGGIGGGLVAAQLTHWLRPKVAAWFRERYGLPEKVADATAERLNPQALVKIARENLPPGALIPEGAVRPSAMSGSAPSGMAPSSAPSRPPAPTSSGTVPASMEIDTSRLGRIQTRPVSPSPVAASPAQVLAGKVKERVLTMKKQGMSRGQMRASLAEDFLRRRDGYKPADVQRVVDLVLGEAGHD